MRYASPVAVYEYDFRDRWIHAAQLEVRLLARKERSYPVCPAGERKCPPEDCGKIRGYEFLLASIAELNHPKHDSLLEQVGGSFDAEAFRPSDVVFDDLQERWKDAFE